MEAHIFQVFDTLPKESPATMWLSIGSPLVSPYLPFYGNINDTSDVYKVTWTKYDTNSYYWIADNLLLSMLKDEAKLKKPIRQSLKDIERWHIKEQKNIRNTLTEKYQQSPVEASTWITQKTLDMTHNSYKAMKYLELKYAEKKP